MNKILISSVIGCIALAGCDGENPFDKSIAVADSGETELVDVNDPNTDPNNRFAYNPAAKLTMNSVTFDDNGTTGDNSDDTLIVNNLPFDGPDGQYNRVAGTTTTNANGIERGAFESLQTPTTGVVKHYAVFMRSDHVEATAAAGRDWGDFGYAGANINRDSFNIPGGVGEYEYTGIYSGVRTFDEGGGLEIVNGDVTLNLDVLDFDPDGNIQGAIVGAIDNRVRVGPTPTGGGALPDVSLVLVQFDNTTGVWEAGEVVTYDPNGDERDRGFHDGMIAGPNGEEMAGYLVMDGVADIQVVQYQVIEWTLGGQTGTVSALTNTDEATVATLVASGLTVGEAVQLLVNTGQTVPTLTADTTLVPAGATTVTSLQTQQVETDFNAQEVGVFIGDITP